MQTHKNLIVWQKSMDLAVLVYKFTKKFPKEELYGIISQMRRAVCSIPFNISEGHGRRSDKELIRFLTFSLGSVSELETQLILSFRLEYLSQDDFNVLNNLNDEVLKMLVALIN
jgi:four helix bundle protein